MQPSTLFPIAFILVSLLSANEINAQDVAHVSVKFLDPKVVGE